MKSICLSALVIIGALSDTCDDGWFTYNSEQGKCMFKCGNEGEYVEIDTLSFDFIAEQCYTVKEAVSYGLCGNTLDDLVWVDDYCDCPYCGCSEEGSTTYEETITNEPYKECEACECTDVYGVTGWGENQTDLIIYCNRAIEMEDPDEYEFYACPPNECHRTRVGYVNDTMTAGDAWWSDVENGTDCNKFCYCPADGDTICQTGFTNIVADDHLNAELNNWCSSNLIGCYDIDTGIYDGDRIYTTNKGESCSQYDCPMCSCPAGKVANETWYLEYRERWQLREGGVSCASCRCVDDGDGVLYTDCDGKWFYEDGAQSCPPTSDEIFSCHDQYSGDSGNKSDEVESEECTVGDFYYYDVPTIRASKNYCEWRYQYSYEWGCGRGVFCEAFADNQCVYTNLTLIETDCEGDIDREDRNEYFKCCDASTANCNYEDMNFDECVESAPLTEYYTSLFECMYGTDSVYQELLCDDSLTELTCSGIYNANKAMVDCQCAANKLAYDRISEASQVLFQSQIDAQLSEYYGGWNEATGCNIEISCDLSTGIASGSDGSTPSPVEDSMDMSTPSPIEIISNECDPACSDDEICNSDGECKGSVVTPDTACTETSGCEDGYVCKTTSGFCYYDECASSGTCNDGYICVETTNTEGSTEYVSGVCQKTTTDTTDSVQRLKVFGSVVVVMIMNFLCN